MDKRVLRRYSVNEDNYNEFKQYVHDELKSITFATYEECYNHVKTIEKIEDSVVMSHLVLWSDKKTAEIKKLEKLEDEIDKAITNHLQGHKKYNPLTNVSIISFGDTLGEVSDKYIPTKSYYFSDPRKLDNIEDAVLINSNILYFIDELIQNKMNSNATMLLLELLKNKIRVIYEDVLITKENEGISIMIKLAVETVK